MLLRVLTSLTHFLRQKSERSTSGNESNINNNNTFNNNNDNGVERQKITGTVFHAVQSKYWRENTKLNPPCIQLSIPKTVPEPLCQKKNRKVTDTPVPSPFSSLFVSSRFSHFSLFSLHRMSLMTYSNVMWPIIKANVCSSCSEEGL